MTRSINLPDDLHERLKNLAEKKGVTVSAIIKMACKEYADREEQKNSELAPLPQFTNPLFAPIHKWKVK